MGFLALGFILALIIFIGLGVLNKSRGKKFFSPLQILSIVGFAALIPAFITKVPANCVGIVYSPFKGTSESVLSEGFHSKSPFDQVYMISTEVQTKSVTNLTTQTKDSQFVNSQLDIKYRVNTKDAHLIYKQYKTLDNMSNSLIIPTTQRVLELITTKYNVMDILGEKRPDIYASLEKNLTTELAKYGVEFYSISITDMDAGAEIEQAITAEAVAKTAVETAEQELLKTKTEAKQKSVEAQAEQDAAKIAAETLKIQAQAEKDANALKTKTLTDSILREKYIEKWDGKLPTYVGGDNSGLMFNMTGENQ